MATYSGHITRAEGEGDEPYYAPDIVSMIWIVRSLLSGDSVVINREQ